MMQFVMMVRVERYGNCTWDNSVRITGTGFTFNYLWRDAFCGSEVQEISQCMVVSHKAYWVSHIYL